jgi:hypothetical protein
MTSVNTMLEQSPLPQLVEGMGKAIAEAQLALDKRSIEIARLLADPIEVFPGRDGKPPEKRSMLELGFTPTFYHFTETAIKARVAFSSSQTVEYSIGGSFGAQFYVFTASVNASYSNKYSFTAEGSSEISTRIVSLPAPAPLTQLINANLARREGEG